MVMAFSSGMKEVLVPIDKAGRVVLPKDLREELDINAGDLLRVSVHGDEVTLRPTKETSGFVRRERALIFTSGRTELLDNETVDTLLTGERERIKLGIAKGFPSPKHR
jgi:AbrB family looped-hinge helix DNA binding protein